MSGREERVARLTRQRRADGARKQNAALAAVEALLRAGRPVTFAAVERAAGVSSWFVYNNAAVRAAVETAREHTEPEPGGTAPAAASLRADLALSREEVRQLRAERDRLLAQVRRGLGSALEHREREGLVEQIRALERQRDVLGCDLATARIDLAKAEESSRLLAEELEAARAAVRRMMRTSARAEA